MERRATITIRGKDASYTARGVWASAKNGWRLVYDEPAEHGMAGVTTALALSERCAVLTRTGAVRSEFRFAEGERHSSVYETAHGSFPAEVATHSLRAKLGEHGGLFEARYTLTLGGAADELRLKILIRTEEEA